MGIWINNDGLRVKLGVDEAKVSRGGEIGEEGSYRQIEQNVKLVNLTTTGVIQNFGITLAKGVIVDSVEVVSEVAATGTGATLDIGLIRQDFTTAYDDDGLVAAQVLSTLSTAGTSTVSSVGTTYAGALLGVPLANTGYLVFSYNTAAFTAGEIKVVVKFHVPQPAASN